MIYYKHGTAKSRKTIFGGYKMKKDWVKINELALVKIFWIGGDFYAVVCGSSTYFYNSIEIKRVIKDLTYLQSLDNI